MFEGDFDFSNSDGGSSFDDSDIEEIQCLMPNGIVLDVLIHPDDEIFHIKQLVLNRATTDGKVLKKKKQKALDKRFSYVPTLHFAHITTFSHLILDQRFIRIEKKIGL